MKVSTEDKVVIALTAVFVFAFRKPIFALLGR